MNLMKKDVLPAVHEILRRRYGALSLLSGQGIAKGERVKFTMDGKEVRCVIKTSNGGRISFGRRDDGSWSGLDDSDVVVIVAPRALNEDAHFVSMFDERTMKEVFELNQAAQMKEGMDLPNWIAPFHEEGRGTRGTGDGFGARAKWMEPLNPASEPTRPPKGGRNESVRSLTIAEAKEGLAKAFGVPPEAVEITIRG